ncbi:MAG: hypothetical protein ABRQ39_20050 [Candidatus Eremiobacterota bacterium]
MSPPHWAINHKALPVWCTGGKISRQNRCILIAYKARWHNVSSIKPECSSLDFSGRAPDRQSRAIIFSGVFTAGTTQ